MKFSQKFRERHSNIIHQTKNMTPENYEVICFDKYLEQKFPNLGMFISSEIISEIKAILKQKYGNDNICCKQYGEFKSIRIDNLKYYQTEVGINGPKHTTIDEPVYVVQKDCINVLLNGYHRVLIHLESGQTEISAFVLRL